MVAVGAVGAVMSARVRRGGEVLPGGSLCVTVKVPPLACGGQRQCIIALRVDRGCAERLTGGIAHGDGRAGLTGAGDRAAILGNGRGGRGRGREVGGVRVMVGETLPSVSLCTTVRFAIPLRRGQRQAVIAICVDRPLADRLAIRVAHDNVAPGSPVR